MFFQMRLYEVLKICEKWYLLMYPTSWCKVTWNQRNGSTFKTQIQIKVGMYLSLTLVVILSSLILSVKNREGVYVCVCVCVCVCLGGGVFA